MIYEQVRLDAQVLALARRQRFAGRALLMRLFGLPLVMPTLVAVFGIVAIYGQTGAINRAAAAIGLPAGRPGFRQGCLRGAGPGFPPHPARLPRERLDPSKSGILWCHRARHTG